MKDELKKHTASIILLVIGLMPFILNEILIKIFSYKWLFWITWSLLIIFLIIMSYMIIPREKKHTPSEMNSEASRNSTEESKITSEQSRKRITRKIDAGIKYLDSLSNDEKELLSSYINKGTKTRYFHPSDGIVGGLGEAYILFRASEIKNFVDNYPFNIRPWAWNYLRENKHLLD